MPWRCAERFMLEYDDDAAARPSTVQPVERQVGILTAEITPISTGNYMVNTCQYKKNLFWHFYRLPPCGFHVSVFACNIYWSTLYIHPQNSVLIFSNITRMKWNCVEIGLMFCGWVVITARILLGWSNIDNTPDELHWTEPDICQQCCRKCELCKFTLLVQTKQISFAQ